jgi:hypothetical protein
MPCLGYARVNLVGTYGQRRLLACKVEALCRIDSHLLSCSVLRVLCCVLCVCIIQHRRVVCHISLSRDALLIAPHPLQPRHPAHLARESQHSILLVGDPTSFPVMPLPRRSCVVVITRPRTHMHMHAHAQCTHAHRRTLSKGCDTAQSARGSVPGARSNTKHDDCTTAYTIRQNQPVHRAVYKTRLPWSTI